MKKAIFILLFLSAGLQANKLIPITRKSDFDRWTNKAKPALLIVTSQWCMKCKQIKTWIEKQDYKTVTFFVIDSRAARNFKAGPVRSLPTLIAYKKGERIFVEPVLDVQVIRESVERSTE